MSEIKLQPCAFCGNNVTWDEDYSGKYSYVHCKECGCDGPMTKPYAGKSQAISLWNQRAADVMLCAEINALREENKALKKQLESNYFSRKLLGGDPF